MSSGLGEAITFVFAHLGMLGEGQHSHPKETQTRTKDYGLHLSRLCSAEHWL
jgi:hypothetical protein